MVNNQTFVGTLRELGLAAESVSLLSITQDNVTTVGAQLSTQLSADPVVSSIGAPG